MEQTNKYEEVSALADGQLHGAAFTRAVESLGADASARDAWHAYHVIGDVLRSADLAPHTPARVFLAGLQQRLAQEPAPVASPIAYLHQAAEVRAAALPARGEAANQSNMRWKVAAGIASVTAATALGWNLVVSAPAQPQLAQSGAPVGGVVLTTAERAPMVRDSQLDQFLAAHRQLAGATALQTPAGFLRNATFEGAAR